MITGRGPRDIYAQLTWQGWVNWKTARSPKECIDLIEGDGRTLEERVAEKEKHGLGRSSFVDRSA